MSDLRLVCSMRATMLVTRIFVVLIDWVQSNVGKSWNLERRSAGRDSSKSLAAAFRVAPTVVGLRSLGLIMV